MTSLLALVKKDLRIFFSRPMFYVLAGLCCLIWSVVFIFGVVSFSKLSFEMSTRTAQTGLNIHQEVISTHVILVHYLLLFVIAAITMKFFSEEKKMRTFPLLLSSPVSSLQLVLAKLMVGACIVGTLLLISLAYPLSLMPFVEIPLAELFVSYLGLFLVLMIYVCTGILASAITESLILSVVLAIVINLSLLLIGVGKEFSSFYWADLFQYLSIDYHFRFFRAGSFSMAGLFYFFSLGALLTFMSERVVEYQRWK